MTYGHAIAFALSIALLVTSAPAATAAPAPRPTVRATSSPSHTLPLAFAPNAGQTDGRVRFVARDRSASIFLDPDGAALALGPNADNALRMSIAGARENARLTGERELPGKVNYLTGSDPSAWRTNLPTYEAVRYESVYDGVDAVFYGTEGRLEYDFVVAPGADPAKIRVRFEGQTAIDTTGEGDLVLRMRGGEIRHQRAVVYQEGAGQRQPVAARFALGTGGEIGFEVGAYDTTRPLVVDPVLVFSGVLASRASLNAGLALAVDSSGSAYSTGIATFGYTTTVGAYAEQPAGLRDLFVTKLDRFGSTVVYSTFLGGSTDDEGYAIAVDADGAAYVTGWSESSDFPTTAGAFDPTPNGLEDAFVAKLSPDGSSLVYSTMLGSGGRDYGYAVAVDAAGAAYVTGETPGLGFPTTPGAFDPEHAANPGATPSAFVTKVAPDGASLAYSTFLGGSAGDTARAISLDASGAAYVTGDTQSSDFPTTPGAYDTSLSGDLEDVFVTKLSADGASLDYSTYLGGEFRDVGFGIAVDASSAACVVGYAAQGFPTTNGAFDTVADGLDAFVTRLAPDGASLLFSTFLGGGDFDSAVAVVTYQANVYVLGDTRSTDFPTVPTTSGAGRAFVAQVRPDGSTLDYLRFLPVGDLSIAGASSLAVDGEGVLYVGGTTTSPDYPVSSFAYSAVYPGPTAFVTKLFRGDVIYSTFLSKTGDDSAVAVAADATGAAYLVGTTNAASYPVTPGSSDTIYNGASDIVVTKMRPDGTSIAYSTFIGGTSEERGEGIAVTASGDAVVVGTTYSQDYPTTPGAFDRTLDDAFDSNAVVARLSADGASLVFSTMLGGNGPDEGTAVALNGKGAVFVTGRTFSTDFPTTPGAFDSTLARSVGYDVFVAKLNASGTKLKRATLLGGDKSDLAVDISVDRTGIVVAGTTFSSDYPTTSGAFDTTPGGETDGFVTKLDKRMSGLVYSTRLGGDDNDAIGALAIDATGAAYLAGITPSEDFPTTPGAFDTTPSFHNLFVTKMSPDGSSLVYSTFVDGSNYDGPGGLAVDATGAVYVVGSTGSDDFPTTPDAIGQRNPDTIDAVLFTLAPDGGSLLFSTLFGGNGDDVGYGVALDPSGAIYACGTTTSQNFRTTNGTTSPPGMNAFVFKLAPSAGEVRPNPPPR